MHVGLSSSALNCEEASVVDVPQISGEGLECTSRTGLWSNWLFAIPSMLDIVGQVACVRSSVKVLETTDCR